MQKLLRSLCLLAVSLSLMMSATPEVWAKKSSNNSKQKTQTRKGAKKEGAKKADAHKTREAKTHRSRRQRETVAHSREQSSRQRETPRVSPNQSETPLMPNRNSGANSSADQDSQDATQQSAPRAVISSIPVERVAEIQTALIKQGYLDGEATGIYDDNTKAAMKKFQVANNLQASGLPSAHALKKLGVSKRGNSLSQVPVKTKSDTEKEPQQE